MPEQLQNQFETKEPQPGLASFIKDLEEKLAKTEGEYEQAEIESKGQKTPFLNTLFFRIKDLRKTIQEFKKEYEQRTEQNTMEEGLTDGEKKEQRIFNLKNKIKKYEKDQTNVKNNREYDAIAEKIMATRFEIELLEKDPNS